MEKAMRRQMAESRIYGKAGSPPNRRRDTTGWHCFTRPRQHGLRRPGKTVTGNLHQTENGLQREGKFRPICRRLSGHRGIERTARKGGETACGALHERTRTRTVPRKKPSSRILKRDLTFWVKTYASTKQENSP